MKVFAILALFFVAAQSSAVWPYAASWNYAAAPYAAAWGAAPWVAAPWSHAPITQYSSYPAHYAAAPAISYAAHVSAPVIAAPVAKVLAVPHSASYTAANRGSVHTAPLPGHAVSQTSLNLAPAPGTH